MLSEGYSNGLARYYKDFSLKEGVNAKFKHSCKYMRNIEKIEKEINLNWKKIKK